MEAYAKVLLFILPLFLALIVIEAVYAYYRGQFNFRSLDTISSLSAGMTNIIKTVLGLTIIIISYETVSTHIAVFQIENNWMVYLLSFLALDFATYCHHRLAHTTNIFWNRHVIHHSGEDFNLATGLRQSITKIVSLSFIFLIPAALLGLPPQVIAVVTPVHFFMQFWYHTEHIGKLGVLEYIIVTPSQHRVHHAINPIYIDKNLSAIFCIWDRMLGTFQEELDDVPCVYGVTRQVRTWNPIKINFLHIWLLTKDAWLTKSLWDKLRIWFMPTGWRPEDVKEKYPVYSSGPENFVKYESDASNRLKLWSWIQFVVLLLMVTHLLLSIGQLSGQSALLYGIYLFMAIYSYTSLMDMDANALGFEMAKSIFGIVIIMSTGHWFLLDNLIPGGTFAVFSYLILSAVIVGYFVVFEIGIGILRLKKA
jgi:sterol desaturase/sphingolipid hydroxylase (fatty acid hydroxylase superfamily)